MRTHSEKKGIVLMFSTDPHIFEQHSAVRQRMVEYAGLFGELHIVALSVVHSSTTKSSAGKSSDHDGAISIAPNGVLYPTHSMSKLSALGDAYDIGAALLSGWVKERQESQVIIVTQDPFETGWIGMRLARRFRVALHVQLHTDVLSPHFFRPFLSKMGMLNRVRRFMGKRVLRRAATVRVVSPRVRDSLVSEWKVPRTLITVLPLQPEFSKEKIEEVLNQEEQAYIDRFTCRVVTVCRLEAEKNIPEMLRAMKIINEKKPGAGLIIVGAGSQLSQLQLLARTLGISHAVHFAGQANPFPYYRSADVYLCASYYEGYGLSLVEAALAGVPIVSTPVGIMGASGPFQDGREVSLYPSGDVEACAEKVCVLLTDPEMRRRYAAAAHAAALRSVIRKPEYLHLFQNAILSSL